MSTYERTAVESDGEPSNEPTARETLDDSEILESEDVDPWKGPFPEYNKYGGLTGFSYVRCRDCGREVLTGRKEFTSHRDGCRFGDDD
ncbi:hypothetical protein [Natronococcus jeotgali]|uniref:DUF8118 domain-containing protein n=1 Tax=Natronococcus jeotgali DSM 18795 TaxID=1227498 RepID=L9XZ08_9EURY|nr:hypothetical protein [Natronococcus jeotgali]ELY66732.1 hypothetical protein C492_00474 [Natronococcus jeotgali DSM 18795]